MKNIPIVLGLLYVVLIGFGVIGWIMNIIKIFSTHDIAWLIGRIIGVFIPIIGAVVGYI